MKKRFLSLLLAAVMVCGLTPTVASAATVTETVPPKYKEVRDSSEGLTAVNLEYDAFSGNKWGFIDATGKEVVPCQYKGVSDFSEGLAAVANFRDGFIDATGKEVVPCQYSKVRNFSEGLAAVNGAELGFNAWGFIDKAGNEVVPCKYSGVWDFSEGLAAVKGNGGWGFIDKTGKEVVPCKYDGVSAHALDAFTSVWDGFSEGLAAVKMDGKWGFIDKTGQEVVPCQYSSVKAFEDGVAIVYGSTGQIKNGFTVFAYGVIDTTGRVVVPCKYDEIKDFDQGFAAVRIGEEYNGNVQMGFIDTTGKEVVPCKYSKVRNFSEGLAAVYEKDKGWGFIDKTGKEVVPIGKYGQVENFSEGLAAVGDYDGWGFIDATGKEVVPRKYARALNFSEGLAAVELDRKWGFIDKTGAEVVPCKYDEIAGITTYGYMRASAPEFHNGLAVVRTSNGWGCIDLYGNEVVPCQYGWVMLLSAGLVAVMVNNRWGILRVEGLPTPTPQQPTAPANTAYASTQAVTVGGKSVTFYAYALKDANGNDTNYIKLRDVADVLNGSAAQFQVGWDGSIAITTGQMYTPNGTENIQNFTGDQTYTVSTSPVTVNGVTANLEAITLTDANGGGYTYFKLRDLGEALGFNVSWSADTGISIDPNSPYDAGN